MKYQPQICKVQETHQPEMCTLTSASSFLSNESHIQSCSPRNRTNSIPSKSTWRLQSEACRVQFWKQFVPIAIFPFPPISFTYVTAIKGAHLTPTVAVERESCFPLPAPALSIRLLLQDHDIINNFASPEDSPPPPHPPLPPYIAEERVTILGMLTTRGEKSSRAK